MSGDTQEQLIQAARQLMLRQGYAATGINDICAQAGVSKGAFYHFFPSKEALAVAALESFHRGGLEQLAAIDVSEAPPADRLPLFVERLADRAPYLWEHGCLTGGLATEMALTNDTLQRNVAKHFDHLAGVVARLAEHFARGLPKGGPGPTTVAEDLLAFIEGWVVLSRAHRDPRRLRAALKRYASSLRQLRRG